MVGFSVVMVERPVVLFSVRACFFLFSRPRVVLFGSRGPGMDVFGAGRYVVHVGVVNKLLRKRFLIVFF